MSNLPPNMPVVLGEEMSPHLVEHMASEERIRTAATREGLVIEGTSEPEINPEAEMIAAAESSLDKTELAQGKSRFVDAKGLRRLAKGMSPMQMLQALGMSGHMPSFGRSKPARMSRSPEAVKYLMDRAEAKRARKRARNLEHEQRRLQG